MKLRQQQSDFYTPCRPWVSDTNRMFQSLFMINGVHVGLCSYLKERITCIYYLDIQSADHGRLAIFENDNPPLAYLDAVQYAEELLIELWKELQQI